MHTHISYIYIHVSVSPKWKVTGPHSLNTTVDLRQSCFSSGQLYIESSRICSFGFRIMSLEHGWRGQLVVNAFKETLLNYFQAPVVDDSIYSDVSKLLGKG